MDRINEWILSKAEPHRRQHGRPLVSLCYAQSLDGSLAARRGEALALSGPESLALTHRLRAAHDAILVGIGTVLADNPSLTVRQAEGGHPQPVILDSHLRFPLEARLLQGHPHKPWIACLAGVEAARRRALEMAGAVVIPLPPGPAGQVDLPALLRLLAERGVNSLMVEGGARVITSFLAQGLADQAVLTLAPLFVGGLHAVEQLLDRHPAGSVEASRIPASDTFPHLAEVDYEKAGVDLIVWGKMNRIASCTSFE